jgi:hypothetical protein
MTDLRVWTIEEVVTLMKSRNLLADMLPTMNEYSKLWGICLSDERGNGIEYIEFVTEEEADDFCEALGLALEANETE